MKKLTLCLSALAVFIFVACNPQATSSENHNAASALGSTDTPAACASMLFNDTEETKSTGLANKLLAEKNRRVFQHVHL